MNEQRRNSIGLVVLMLLTSVFLFNACGNSQKKSTAAASTAGQAAAAVGMSTCTTCHTVVIADWLASKHANLDPDGALDSPGSPTNAQVAAGACANCHDPNGDSGSLTALTGSVARPVVGCEACHGGGSEHNGSGPIARDGWAAATAGRSAQFNTCTTVCHELLDSAGTGTIATTHDAASSVTPTGTQYAITDTHFATPSLSSGLYAVNGYAMDYSSGTVCADCHNPHKSTNVTTEWAQSAKADRYRSGQDPQGYFSAAWSRSNWSASSRTRCQRCHTTTGFKKYADALRFGIQATVDGMIDGTVAALTAQADNAFKPEMLQCHGCHADNKGGLRNPGPVTARYDVVMSYPASTDPLMTYAQVSHTYPNVADSNVCITCHVGRESGDSIKQLNVQAGMTAVDFNNLSFQSSHYLTGGGTVFTVTGYELGGRSYENPASYLHDQIGVDDFRSTGNRGPCVGCHMSRSNGNGNHLFLPVSRFNRVRYNAGTVTVPDTAANSATVTGASTLWSSAGIDTTTDSTPTTADTFRGPDGRAYLIQSVDSDTQITLTSNYRGTAAAAQNYVIAKDGLRVTGIASEACFNCHAGTSILLVDQLNEGRELFEDALRALEHALDKKGYCYFDGNIQRLRYNAGTVSATKGGTVVTGSSTLFQTGPATAISTSDKFRVYNGEEYDIQSVDSETQITLKSPYLGENVSGVSYAILLTGSVNRVTDWTAAGDLTDDPTGATLGKNNMGAVFNLNLFEHDPGAYVHNRTYVKRLIYDSIDWTDDGVMNYSVGDTLNKLGAEPYKTGAILYILPNGVLGIAAERP